MTHVFISYVAEDYAVISGLAQDLKKHGIRVWLDRDELKAGQHWKIAIREAIQAGSYFLACFSNNYHARSRTYMNEELTLAIEELRLRPVDRAWFIPLLTEQCELPLIPIGAGATLRDIQAIHLFQDHADGLRRLLDAIHATSVAEQRWKVILENLFKRGMKTVCVDCGTRWDWDNIYICASCGFGACYLCRGAKCKCGGDFRSVTHEEWVYGYALRKSQGMPLRRFE